MVWGYGDRGYGPYRVTQMMKQHHAVEVLSEAFEFCQRGDAKGAYEFLSKNRIRILGPSYGSKFITFCTPRDIGAPIYDSLIAMWVKEFAAKEFLGVTTSSESWNLKTYSRYWDWVKEHADELECYPDEIELVLFRDAERKFSKASNWLGKQKYFTWTGQNKVRSSVITRSCAGSSASFACVPRIFRAANPT